MPELMNRFAVVFHRIYLDTISYIPGDNKDVPYELAPAVSDYETPVVYAPVYDNSNTQIERRTIFQCG